MPGGGDGPDGAAELDDEEDDADDVVGVGSGDGGGGGGAGDGGGGGGRAGGGGRGRAGGSGAQKKKKTTYKMLMLKHPTTGVMTPIFWDRWANIFAARQMRNGGKALDKNLSQRVFCAATDGATAPMMVVALATAVFSRKMQRLNMSSIDILKDDTTDIFTSSSEEEKLKDAAMLEALQPLQVLLSIL